MAVHLVTAILIPTHHLIDAFGIISAGYLSAFKFSVLVAAPALAIDVIPFALIDYQPFLVAII